MDLYKDKECTIPALCPMAFSNEYIMNTSFYCDSDCAWCSPHNNFFICAYADNHGAVSCPLYAKEKQ